MSQSLLTHGECKICIIQMEAVHEEIIPSLVKALNDNSIFPDVYINANCKRRRGDIFREIKSICCNIFYINIEKAQDWEDLKSTVHVESYDACIFSTYQHKGIINFSLSLDAPIFGVVHNVSLFKESFFTVGDPQARQNHVQGLIVLSQHVKDSIKFELSNSAQIAIPIEVIQPFFWKTFHINDHSLPNSSGIKYAVPGGVNFKNRDFFGLVDALNNSSVKRISANFSILGGGKDREKLFQIVKEHNLSHCFSFAPQNKLGWVDYNHYYSLIRSSDVILPLAIDDVYNKNKITSAIPTSIGFCKPCLISQSMQQIYKIPAYKVKGSLADSLSRMHETIRVHHESTIRSILEKKMDSLEQNKYNIKRLINLIQS